MSTQGWSNRSLAVVAKTDSESSLTLSLPAHLEDAMAVAAALWCTFLPAHIKDFLVTEVGDECAAPALARFLAGTHDVGKASNEFQRNLPPWSTPDLARQGLAPAAIRNPIPHGTLGQVAMREWLATMGEGAGTEDLAEVIGGHHGLNPTRADLRSARVAYLPLEPRSWREVRVEILEEMADRSGVRPYLQALVRRGLSLPARALLQATVILADWIASDSERFPYLDDRPSTARAADALADIGFIPPWSPSPSEVLDFGSLFSTRFPRLHDAAANSVQAEAVRLASSAHGPCLMIVEARPGLGKTEAGLMAAEMLAARFGCGGVLVALPTMATANSMFSRVAAWLQTMGGQTNSLNLAHGKAALNADFEALTRRPTVKAVYDEPGPSVGVVLAVSWLRGRKRSLLANSVVGTIDQYLMAGLKAKHVVLRHLALAGKVVIIDEVHAADEFMREYALTMLEWLGRYRTPVILMSATLPPDQRRDYLAAYAGRAGAEQPAPSASVAYPRISLYDGSLHESLLESPESVQVSIETLDDSPERLVAVLRQALADGGCAAVIRNTVTRAQETFELLRLEFGPDVVLHHSRFIAPHRAARERELVDQLGRDGTRPHRLVVVGTQVLEQSLDIDFDIMVTDLAPVDLLLQRAGRLHRHNRPRPPRLRDPRLLLAGADWQCAPPRPVRGSLMVYGRSKLLRSAAVLADALERGWMTLPEQTPSLVADGYDPELKPPAGWESDWAEAEARAEQRSADARRRAQTFAIAPPVDRDSMSGWLAAPADDPEDPRRLGQAQVRDGSDSLEVIVVQRDEDGHLRLPSGPGPMAGALIPDVLPIDDWRLAKAMAQTTISLPQSMCANPVQLDATIAALEGSLHYDTWQASPWIKGQLALVLDPEGESRVAGFDLLYSDDLGLTAHRMEGVQ